AIAMEDRMRKRVLFGVSAAAAVLFGQGVLAQGLSELDRALAKSDPSGELLAGFNELASATTNIAPPSAAPDQDKAKAAEVRAALQDPNGIAMARDPVSAPRRKVPRRRSRSSRRRWSRISAID